VKSWENLTRKHYRLLTSPVSCSHCTLGNWKKVVFNSIIHTYFWLFTLCHKKTIYRLCWVLPTCRGLAHPTWWYHHTNLWITKLFHLTEGLLRSFRRWRLWKEPVVGCCRWLWKEPVVMNGSWNARQAISQQVSGGKLIINSRIFAYFKNAKRLFQSSNRKCKHKTCKVRVQNCVHWLTLPPLNPSSIQ